MKILVKNQTFIAKTNNGIIKINLLRIEIMHMGEHIILNSITADNSEL
jgi:hypothetical protein